VGNQQKLTDASNTVTATAIVTDKKLPASPGINSLDFICLYLPESGVFVK